MRWPPLSRQAAIRVSQAALALGLLAALAYGVDGAAALRLLAGADMGWLAAALVALTVQTLLSALRWRLTAAQLDQRIGVGRAVREYYLSQIVNQSLPGGVLGDAGRAVRARAGAGLVRAWQAVLFERLAGQAMMFAVLIAAVAAVTLAPGGIVLPAWVFGPVALIAGGSVTAIAFVATGHRLPGAVGRGARGLSQAFARAVLNRHVLPMQLALSLGTTICNLAAFAFCARATGTLLDPVATAVLVPLILSTMLLPITVSGWGLREGAAAALFPVIGASHAGGLAASIAFGLVYLASVLPGVVSLVASRPATVRSRQMPPAARPTRSQTARGPAARTDWARPVACVPEQNI